MLLWRIIFPIFQTLLSPTVTCLNFDEPDLDSDLSLKILNVLPSQPVLLCVKKIGNPSSIKMNIEDIIIIGDKTIKAKKEKNLSIKFFIKKLVP